MAPTQTERLNTNFDMMATKLELQHVRDEREREFKKSFLAKYGREIDGYLLEERSKKEEEAAEKHAWELERRTMEKDIELQEAALAALKEKLDVSLAARFRRAIAKELDQMQKG